MVHTAGTRSEVSLMPVSYSLLQVTSNTLIVIVITISCSMVFSAVRVVDVCSQMATDVTFCTQKKNYPCWLCSYLDE